MRTVAHWRDQPRTLLIVVGLQLLLMGLLGELVARVYYGAMNKPTYVVREPPKAGNPPRAPEGEGDRPRHGQMT